MIRLLAVAAGRRWLAAAVAALAVASAAGCAYLDTKQREWIFRAQRDIHSTPASYGLPFEEVWLAVAGDADGARARVHGWWIPGPDATAPTLLYLHGARRNLSDNLFRIQRLHRMGFAVLAIDYRGFGRSDGELPSEAQAYEDAQAAWQQLRRLEPKGDMVVHQELVFGGLGRVRDVIVGPDGYLYVLLQRPGQVVSQSTSGMLARLIPIEP